MARISKVHSEVLPSATASIAKAAVKEVDIVDALGRKLHVKKATLLDKMRLMKALGSENSNNDSYFSHCLAVCSVTAIDDEPVPPPVTDRQIEALAERLGDEGFGAVIEAHQEWRAASADEVRDEVKNS